MNKTYIVRLTDADQQARIPLTKSGKAAAYKSKHAHILLPVATNGPHWSDAHGAKALHGHGNTGRNVRHRFVAQGLEAALVRQPPATPSRPRRLDGAKAAHLLALRCRQPPAGQAKWTLPWLADKRVELAVVEPISDETVRQTLQKTRANRLCTSAG